MRGESHFGAWTRVQLLPLAGEVINFLHMSHFGHPILGDPFMVVSLMKQGIQNKKSNNYICMLEDYKYNIHIIQNRPIHQNLLLCFASGLYTWM